MWNRDSDFLTDEKAAITSALWKLRHCADATPRHEFTYLQREWVCMSNSLLWQPWLTIPKQATTFIFYILLPFLLFYWLKLINSEVKVHLKSTLFCSQFYTINPKSIHHFRQISIVCSLRAKSGVSFFLRLMRGKTNKWKRFYIPEQHYREQRASGWAGVRAHRPSVILYTYSKQDPEAVLRLTHVFAHEELQHTW